MAAQSLFIKKVLKKLTWFFLTLFGVSCITFFLSMAIPGDPVHNIIGDRASEEVAQYYRQALGLDQPVWTQFFRFIKRVVKGDLGLSIYTGKSVSEEIQKKFPNTLLLATAAILIALLGGIIGGGLCAFWPNSWLDRFCLWGSTLLISLPVFWFGMLLVFCFAVKLNWFPVGGMDSPLAWVLPSFTLGARSMAYFLRLTRSIFMENLSHEYILFVRAKGGGKMMIFMHILRNAMAPLLTFLLLDFGSYLNGSVLTESIFGWDGLGRYAINGIFRRDYPVIMGCVIFGTFVFVLIHLILDLLYHWVDPRVEEISE